MEREIKFRMLAGNKMLYDFENVYICLLQQLAFDQNYKRYIQYNHKSDNSAFMQFTGLKDKNGKELYAGDIFTDGKHKYRVYSVPGGFAISIPAFKSTLTGTEPWPLQPLADSQTVSWFEGNCEIIGNIYENPDLIQ